MCFRVNARHSIWSPNIYVTRSRNFLLTAGKSTRRPIMTETALRINTLRSILLARVIHPSVSRKRENRSPWMRDAIKVLSPFSLSLSILVVFSLLYCSKNAICVFLSFSSFFSLFFSPFFLLFFLSLALSHNYFTTIDRLAPCFDEIEKAIWASSTK